MWKTTPVTVFFLVTLMPWLDPPGVLSFKWDATNITAILISALLGFLLQWSGALALGYKNSCPPFSLGCCCHWRIWGELKHPLALFKTKELKIYTSFLKISMLAPFMLIYGFALLLHLTYYMCAGQLQQHHTSCSGSLRHVLSSSEGTCCSVPIRDL